MNENTSRNRIRRTMAQSSMVLVWVIIIAFLWGLASDDLADRVAKVWPPFVIIFPSLIAQIGHYIHVGSRENIESMKKDVA